MTKSEAVTVSDDLDSEIATTDHEIGVAFDRIVDATTRLMDLTGDLPREVGNAMHQALEEILEASATRDIAGQRLSKVRRVVRSLSAGAGPVQLEEVDPLLNGPQQGDQAPDQDEIDALFASAGADDDPEGQR